MNHWICIQSHICFLIYNHKNIPIRIVFEVSNTFGERHAYACKVNKK